MDSKVPQTPRGAVTPRDAVHDLLFELRVEVRHGFARLSKQLELTYGLKVPPVSPRLRPVSSPMDRPAADVDINDQHGHSQSKKMHFLVVPQQRQSRAMADKAQEQQALVSMQSPVAVSALLHRNPSPVTKVSVMGKTTQMTDHEFRITSGPSTPSLAPSLADYKHVIAEHSELRSTHRKNSFHSSVWEIFNRSRFEMAEENSLLRRCALSGPFNSVCMAFIVLNGMWLGYDVQSNLGAGKHWQESVSMGFTLWFILELMFKIIALRQYFFTGPDWIWNVFDVLLVLLSIPEFFTSSMNVSMFRIMRLGKLSKTLRVVRVLKFVRSLREIIVTVLLTFGTLFWCFVAIILVTYTSSLTLLEAISMSLDDGVEFNDHTMHTFRSVWSTMMALFGMITGGQEWYAFFLDFEKHGAYFPQYLLAVWIYFMMFGFVNIVLAVFCAQGTDAASADVELRLEGERERRSAKMSELVKIWNMIDTEGKGKIDWEQFHDFGIGPVGQSYFQSHGLQLLALQDVWSIMDKYEGSQDRVVDLSSFVMVFLRLSGENFGTELVRLSVRLSQLQQEFREACRELRNDIKKDLECI